MNLLKHSTAVSVCLIYAVSTACSGSTTSSLGYFAKAVTERSGYFPITAAIAFETRSSRFLFACVGKDFSGGGLQIMEGLQVCSYPPCDGTAGPFGLHKCRMFAADWHREAGIWSGVFHCSCGKFANHYLAGHACLNWSRCSETLINICAAL